MRFTKFPLLILVLLFCVITTGGVFASWYYAVQDAPTVESDSSVSVNQFIYSEEVVIIKRSTISSSVVKEDATLIHPTKITSSIKGNAGQKIVYKVVARNFSKEKTYIYTGASHITLNGLNISASLDSNNVNQINGDVSAVSHQGTPIAPGEDFVFYITYTLTSGIDVDSFEVNYVFKPIEYSVTYLYGNDTFAIDYVTNNQVDYSVKTQGPQHSSLVFGGWVNANAVVINKIPAGNTSNYNLSASWENRYIIIFADAQGNILYEEQFTSSSTALSSEGQATVDRILAELNAEAEKDHMSVSWSDYTIKGAKADISVKAIYAYNGVLNLEPVYEQPDDGIVDYYQVKAVDTLPETVRIPGSIGGVPVKVVLRVANKEGSSDWNNYASGVYTIIVEEGVESLSIKGDDEYNTNALAYTPNLKLVQLPSTLKYIGKNAFSRNFGDDKKVITIEFNGTKAEWKAIEKHSDWDNGLKTDTIVRCSDGYFKLKTTEFLGVTLSKSWSEY